MATLERKTSRGYDIKVTDADQGIMEAIVSVFNNRDHGGDIVRPGFFDQAVSDGKLPKGVWAHDPTIPVAKTLATTALKPGDSRLPAALKDLGGQWVRAQFNLETQRGREAFSDIKGGYIDEFSFAYYATKTNYLDDGSRELLSTDEWPEWSPVLQGMNPKTALISAKSADASGGEALNDGALVSLSEDATTTIAGVKRLSARFSSRLELLRKQGRMLSAANIAKLNELIDLLDQVDTVQGVLKDLVAAANADQAEEDAEGEAPAKSITAADREQERKTLQLINDNEAFFVSLF